MIIDSCRKIFLHPSLSRFEEYRKLWGLHNCYVYFDNFEWKVVSKLFNSVDTLQLYINFENRMIVRSIYESICFVIVLFILSQEIISSNNIFKKCIQNECFTCKFILEKIQDVENAWKIFIFNISREGFHQLEWFTENSFSSSLWIYLVHNLHEHPSVCYLLPSNSMKTEEIRRASTVYLIRLRISNYFGKEKDSLNFSLGCTIFEWFNTEGNSFWNIKNLRLFSWIQLFRRYWQNFNFCWCHFFHFCKESFHFFFLQSHFNSFNVNLSVSFTE